MAKWIKKAVGDNKGKFAAKAEKAGESTAAFARDKADASGTLGKEARLAQTLMREGRKARSKRNRTLYDRTKD